MKPAAIVAGGALIAALGYGALSTSLEEIPESFQDCHPSYSGCLKPDAGDYDCTGGSGNGPNYTGKVRVIGYDEFDLDRDEDGWGCER